MEPQYDELLINHLNTDAEGMGLALVSQQGRWGMTTRNEPRIPLVYDRIKGWFGHPEAMGSQQYVRATRQGRTVEIRFDAETGRLLGESAALEERPVRYGGLGVTIVAQQGAVVVMMAVHPKGAGATGGLRAGDRIETIDGQSTAHMTVQDATLRLRGQSGSTVKLTVRRDTKTLTLNPVRADIANADVDASAEAQSH